MDLAVSPSRPTLRGAEALQLLRAAWHRHTATALLGLLAVFAFLPGAAAWLQFDRAAIAGGQFWRPLTGHLTHWNTDHLLWDTLAFIALGALCERINRRRFLWCTLAAAGAISAAVWLLLPTMSLYRGLSGIDSALLALLAAWVLRDAWPKRDWALIALTIGSGLAFAAKVVYEARSGATLFVDSPAAGMTPVPLAHIVGALTGLLVGILPHPAASPRPHARPHSRAKPLPCASIPERDHRTWHGSPFPKR